MCFISSIRSGQKLLGLFVFFLRKAYLYTSRHCPTISLERTCSFWLQDLLPRFLQIFRFCRRGSSRGDLRFRVFWGFREIHRSESVDGATPTRRWQKVRGHDTPIHGSVYCSHLLSRWYNFFFLHVHEDWTKTNCHIGGWKILRDLIFLIFFSIDSAREVMSRPSDVSHKLDGSFKVCSFISFVGIPVTQESPWI